MGYQHAWSLNVADGHMTAEHDYEARRTRVTMRYADGAVRFRTGPISTDPGAIGRIANKIERKHT